MSRCVPCAAAVISVAVSGGKKLSSLAAHSLVEQASPVFSKGSYAYRFIPLQTSSQRHSRLALAQANVIN